MNRPSLLALGALVLPLAQACAPAEPGGTVRVVEPCYIVELYEHRNRPATNAIRCGHGVPNNTALYRVVERIE